MNRIIPLVVLLYAATFETARAQQLSIEQYSWKLSAIGYDMVECRKEEERDSCLELFNATIDSLIELPGSFLHGFDSVKNVKILNSPRQDFRIITWGFRHANDSFRFYGILQYADPEKAAVWLIDSSRSIGNSELAREEELGPERWFGALYYSIHEVRYKKEPPYYVLLGWNGNTRSTDIKIIETLSWNDEGEPVFGKQVFRTAPEEEMQYRVIFEYGNSASMALRYDADKNQISFENVVPSDPKALGEYALYLPDGTYDYYRFKKGVWQKYSEY